MDSEFIHESISETKYNCNMSLIYKYICILIFAAALAAGCARQPMQVASIESELIAIDSTLDAIQDSDYLVALAPIKADLEAELSKPLGVANMELTSGRPESTMGNWASDALKAMADQWLAEQGMGKADLAVVNIGGLRCDWPKGNITFRHVFELMPFDNELVILTLTGNDLMELAQNCLDSGGEGISKEMHVWRKNGETQASLHGKAIVAEATYLVATSDYLSGGADGLSALTRFSTRTLSGLKIRDLYISYIQEVRVVESALDGRIRL